MQFETLVRCEVPRCNCPEHGVKTVHVPWAGKGSRFTLLFESFAIDVLKACSSVMAASELMDMNWHQINQIKRRAVARGLNQAIDKVRRQEHKVLSSQKDDTLKGSEYLWLTGFENLSEEMQARFSELQSLGLKVGRPRYQGNLRPLLGLPVSRLCAEVLQTVVWVGAPQQTRTR